MHDQLVLAALASAAVPGLNPKVTELQAPEGNCDVAHITDDRGNVWVCRRPNDTHAGMIIETEAGLLRVLSDAGLPFGVPRPAGFANLPEGGRAMIYPLIAGDKPYFYDAEPGDALLDHIARSIAAIHELPAGIADAANLATYNAATFRERRLTTLNLAEQLGKVPDTLITRWRRLFNDVEFWDFTPVLAHSALSMENVLVVGDEVSVITQWAKANVADPAEDISWLIGQLNYEAAQYFFERYLARRNPRNVDENLWERANLVGEMQPMEQLLSAHRAGDVAREEYAMVMLVDLEEALAESVRRQAEYALDTTLQQGEAISQGLPFVLGSAEPGGFLTGGIRVINPHSASGAVQQAPGTREASAAATEHSGYVARRPATFDVDEALQHDLDDVTFDELTETEQLLLGEGAPSSREHIVHDESRPMPQRYNITYAVTSEHEVQDATPREPKADE